MQDCEVRAECDVLFFATQNFRDNFLCRRNCVCNSVLAGRGISAEPLVLKLLR
jgi:hypothetical protein